jgi:hypothetical protein
MKKSYIKLERFKRLGQLRQASLLYQKGRKLAQIQEKGLQFTLYTIDSFFVELAYEPQTFELLPINAFRHTEPLEKYCKSMNVQKLFSLSD